MGPLWRIDMLGALRASSEDATITRFRTRRVGLLLAYLAYYRDRSFSRDELADMLWPDFGVDQARINLRQTLASLRRHVEPPSVPKGAVLVTEQDRISINPSLVETDTARFSGAIASARKDEGDRIPQLREATELYKGDFLPGYYEDWVITERHRLEDQFLAALQDLIDACDSEGRLHEAIPQIHAALSKDRLREDLHLALMRAYVASGSPARALRHYEDWRTLSRSELGSEPSPEIKGLADGLKKGENKMPSKERRETSPGEVAVTRAEPRAQENTVRLPIQLTRFFGRSQESRHVLDQFDSQGSRLVTLLGPAGAGKTRLSIEVGRRLADEHGWNVWFVPLADISNGEMLLDTVLSTMRVRRDGRNSLLEELQAGVSGPKNLLILDNLEHIVDSATPLIASILHGATGISCLTTSRQSLKLQGEHVIDLSSLAVQQSETTDVNPSKVCSRNHLLHLASMPGAQLFVDRAQAVQPDFQLTARNAYAVAAICSKLDGLPLAIEIAAGLSNAFTPGQLLANLGDRLEILRSRFRDVSPRHRSLWAAIDYSYELLAPELQRFFAELSIFRGGFTVEAAEKVCLPSSGGSNGQIRKRSRECLRAILDLQERSLLKTEEVDERCGARFRLLESFREFGQERLSPEEEEALRLRHAEFYFHQAEEYLAPRKRPPANPDRENWLIAIETFRRRGDLQHGVGILAGLRGGNRAEREIALELVVLPEVESLASVERVWLFVLASRTHRFNLSFEESRDAALRALAIAEEFGADDQLCLCHAELSDTVSFLGSPEEALKHAEKILYHGQKGGNVLAIEIGYINIGTMQWSMGDLEGSIQAFRGAQQASIKLNHGEANWNILHNLARVQLDAGALDDALQFASEGLHQAQRVGDVHGTSLCLSMIARYHLLKGNFVAAMATNHEALLKRRGSFLFWLFNGIQVHARILLFSGLYREGTTLLAASRMVAIFKRESDDREYSDSVTRARASLPESEFERAWAEGLAMSLDEAFTLAIEFQ